MDSSYWLAKKGHVAVLYKDTLFVDELQRGFGIP